MMRPLRVVGMDLATIAGFARTHDGDGNPRLSTHSVDAGMRPLHAKVHLIETAARMVCGVPRTGGPPYAHAQPDLVVVEGSFSAGNAADYPLHAMRANVLQWLWRMGIPYAEVAPATLKVFATGSGATSGENKVTKAEVCAAVIATYGGLMHINPRDDNSCDAVAAMALGCAYLGQPLAEVPASHTRALKSVKWPDPVGGTR